MIVIQITNFYSESLSTKMGWDEILRTQLRKLLCKWQRDQMIDSRIGGAISPFFKSEQSKLCLVRNKTQNLDVANNVISTVSPWIAFAHFFDSE